MTRAGLGQQRPAAHVLQHPLQDLPERGGVRAVGGQLQGIGDGETGPQQCQEFLIEQQEVIRLDLGTTKQLDTAMLRADLLHPQPTTGQRLHQLFARGSSILPPGHGTVL